MIPRWSRRVALKVSIEKAQRGVPFYMDTHKSLRQIVEGKRDDLEEQGESVYRVF